MPAPVTLSCDLSTPSQPLHHPWRHCVGSCHAPLALRADWQQQRSRIDDTHANPQAEWLRLGSPEYPQPHQVDALERASRVVPEPLEITRDGDHAGFSLPLPANAMALVRIEWEAA
jgi:beta-xylosidase